MVPSWFIYLFIIIFYWFKFFLWEIWNLFFFQDGFCCLIQLFIDLYTQFLELLPFHRLFCHHVGFRKKLFCLSCFSLKETLAFIQVGKVGLACVSATPWENSSWLGRKHLVFLLLLFPQGDVSVHVSLKGTCIVLTTTTPWKSQTVLKEKSVLEVGLHDSTQLKPFPLPLPSQSVPHSPPLPTTSLFLSSILMLRISCSV